MNLHDAIDQDKFIIDDRAFTDDEIQAMDIDALETLKMQIVKKISGLCAAVKEKQLECAQGRESASKEWHMRRVRALSINQRVLTYVNALLKRRFRMSRTTGDYFINKAKDILPRDVFNHILNDARQEMANAGISKP
jgi:hypothetical protein